MTVAPADALKGALDILHPLAICSPRAMRILNQETGIQRSRVNRQIKRIKMAIGQMEEEKMKKQIEKFVVVYGETVPAWERVFETKQEAEAFKNHCNDIGDIWFFCGLDSDPERPKALLGRSEQDIDPSAPNYRSGISKEVL